MKTLKESKSHHQHVDVKSVKGKVLRRRRPCHECKGCMELDPQAIINDCKHNDRCGKAEYFQIKFSRKPTLVITRATAAKAGQVLANKAKAGDFLARGQGRCRSWWARS